MDAVEQAFESLHGRDPITAIDSTQIDILAKASKTTPAVRTRLGQPENVNRLVEALDTSLNDDFERTTVALRCIGNACIDNHAARDEISALGFRWMRRCLSDDNDDVKMLAVKVLYNICSDHEPAQRQCYGENLDHQLIDICASPLLIDNEELSILVEVLFSITSQMPKDATYRLPDDVLIKLLSLPYYHYQTADLDDFAMLLAICLTYLRNPSVQSQVVQGRHLDLVWRTLVRVETKVLRSPPGSSDTAEVLKPLSASFLWCLSDIAAHADFVQEYPLNDAFTVDLLHTIKTRDEGLGVAREDIVTSDEAATQISREAGADPDETEIGGRSDRRDAAAYQVVGNLLWALPPADFSPLVLQEKLHEAAWRAVCDGSAEEDLLHSAAGLLVQLSRPSAIVREIIGRDEHAQMGLASLCEHKTSQLQQDGIKLLKALGRECPENQTRFAHLAKQVIFSSSNDHTAAPDGPG